MIIATIFLNGLTLAGLLYIVTSGLGLSFGLMRVINLTHGAFYLTGGYVGLTVLRALAALATHVNSGILAFLSSDIIRWILAILAGGIAMAMLAFLEERFLLKRKQVREDPLIQTLVTLALAIIIGDLDLIFWTGKPQSIPMPKALRTPISLFGIVSPRYRLSVIILAIVIAIGLWLLLRKTRVGITIRAGIDDSEMVRALGINVEKVFTLVFTLAGFLAGIAGVIGGSFSMLGPVEDWRMLRFALVVVIIGGMGSFSGTLIGALLTAIIFSYASVYIPSFSLFLLFMLVAVVLAIRPQGLFGRKT